LGLGGILRRGRSLLRSPRLCSRHPRSCPLGEVPLELPRAIRRAPSTRFTWWLKGMLGGETDAHRARFCAVLAAVSAALPGKAALGHQRPHSGFSSRAASASPRRLDGPPASRPAVPEPPGSPGARNGLPNWTRSNRSYAPGSAIFAVPSREATIHARRASTSPDRSPASTLRSGRPPSVVSLPPRSPHHRAPAAEAAHDLTELAADGLRHPYSFETEGVRTCSPSTGKPTVSPPPAYRHHFAPSRLGQLRVQLAAGGRGMVLSCAVRLRASSSSPASSLLSLVSKHLRAMMLRCTSAGRRRCWPGPRVQILLPPAEL